MNLNRNPQVIKIGIGRYISLSNSLTANQKVEEHEWNILNQMPRIKYSGYTNENSVDLVIIMANKLESMYKILGRTNVSIADKRRFLTLMAEGIIQ